MQKGNIGVTTENIFPIIKKFLYSDHEIFLRELVSNATDATQKLKTLSSVGEFKGELGDTTIEVSLTDSTITITDKGIGMTAEEIEKYINQIAFSGANDFMEKYQKDANAIIGHFGLGFYSAFMVASKVEIRTLSYKEGAEAMMWSCDGNPEYQLEPCDKSTRGTEITLYIDEENKNFLDKNTIQGLLKKYCSFLPIAIAFGKKQEWKDGKYVDTDALNIINDTNPAWTRKPADLQEEDYNSFYSSLYPMAEDPLFHIHLNVDYPFNLTGILYFPKIKSNIEIQKNKIQLYCNQVYVTDSVEGIVPDFMTLLHGVIDSPDIPLNVSRSYLQSDNNVKKISAHITKKVSDRLEEIFKKDRANFESKWDDLKMFIEYGMLTEEKFAERAAKFALLKNVDSKYFTREEYIKLIENNQTDKEGNKIILYAANKDDQYTYIDAATAKGYDVLIMDGQLDSHYIGHLEQKMEKCRFVRVDSDTIDNLIGKDVDTSSDLNTDRTNELTDLISSQLPKVEKSEFIVSFAKLGSHAQPIILTRNEFMRRMKEMQSTGGAGPMSFYGEMPDSYNLVVNTDQPLVQKLMQEQEQATSDSLSELYSKKSVLEQQKSDIEKSHKDKKADEIPVAEKEQIKEIDSQLSELRSSQKAIMAAYGKDNSLLNQLIDLALLANGMLKGEALNRFVKRSIKMI